MPALVRAQVRALAQVQVQALALAQAQELLQEEGGCSVQQQYQGRQADCRDPCF